MALRRHFWIISVSAVALTAGACDAGVERRAQAAIERRDNALAPSVAQPVISSHADEMARTTQAYEAALKAAGYADALAEEALTSSEAFALGPERMAAAKAAVLKHRALALTQTDSAILQLKALRAEHPGEAARIDTMLDELLGMRERRAVHWGHAESIIDETLGAWRALNTAEGDWALESDGLKFTRLKDREAYDAHAAKISAHVTRQQKIMAEQSRSAAKLMQLSQGNGA